MFYYEEQSEENKCRRANGHIGKSQKEDKMKESKIRVENTRKECPIVKILRKFINKIHNLFTINMKNNLEFAKTGEKGSNEWDNSIKNPLLTAYMINFKPFMNISVFTTLVRGINIQHIIT